MSKERDIALQEIFTFNSETIGLATQGEKQDGMKVPKSKVKLTIITTKIESTKINKSN